MQFNLNSTSLIAILDDIKTYVNEEGGKGTNLNLRMPFDVMNLDKGSNGITLTVNDEVSGNVGDGIFVNAARLTKYKGKDGSYHFKLTCPSGNVVSINYLIDSEEKKDLDSMNESIEEIKKHVDGGK